MSFVRGGGDVSPRNGMAEVHGNRTYPVSSSLTDHLLDGFRKRVEVVFADPKDLLGIDIKIVVGDDIPKTF